MVDRKGRTVTLKLPWKLNAGLIKTAIEKDLSSKVMVFQYLDSGEFLVELSSKNAAESLIEDGFDWMMSMLFVIPCWLCYKC